ncbi:MAG: PD-(D/E)XK nuclease family protein [Deltaproteobacteria bacterium]|nr:PD-(D/E)XK nuclease family protein [Deltaproteobacteria bacterium]
MSRENAAPKVDWARVFKRILFLDNHSRARTDIYVTDLTGCARKAYYNILFCANPPPTTHMIVGRLCHLGFQALLASYKDEFKELRNVLAEVDMQVPLNDVWTLKGRVDLLVEVDDEVHLIELKFSRSAAKNPDLKDMYVVQLNTYLGMFMQIQKPSVPVHGWLVIFDTGNTKLRIEALRVEYNEAMYRETVNKALDIARAVEEQEPPKPEPKADWECKYCPWRALCREQSDRTITDYTQQ